MEINKDLIIEGHNTSLENITGKLITTSDTDLNDYRSAGVFIFMSSTKPTNRPDGEVNGFVNVITEGDNTNSQWVKQIWFGVASEKVYMRQRTSSGWTTWERMASESDINTLQTSINNISQFGEKGYLGSEDDFNNYKTYGIWFFGGTPINSPCYNGWLFVLGHSASNVKQIVFRLGSSSNHYMIWVRTLCSGAWQDWKQIQFV